MLDSTVQRERAMFRESTVLRERAAQAERTIVWERVVSGESTVPDERAPGFRPGALPFPLASLDQMVYDQDMTKTDQLFGRITQQVIDAIEAGAGEWHMPWHAFSAGTPKSVDGRNYRGLNSLVLAITAADAGYESGIWGTYKAWKRHGAQVRKGQHGTEVVLWKPITVEPENDDDEPQSRLIARSYFVFNADQVDGYELPESVKIDGPERIEHAERFFAGYDVNVTEGGSLAFYDRGADVIHLPDFDSFESAASYYATRAHESVHSTGHGSRLDRTFGKRFGDDAYAAEELVAELGAAMWSGLAGVSTTPRPDHAAYLASWLRVLRSDAKALLTATSKAQAAVDFLNTHTTDPYEV